MTKQMLGKYLAGLRNSRGLSLRAVEELTQKDISNAYLSQVENGQIAQPSPNILYTLAEVYGVPYEEIMEKAGYIMPLGERKDDEKHGKAITSAFGYLTKTEEEKLLEYLAFLRTRKNKK